MLSLSIALPVRAIKLDSTDMIPTIFGRSETFACRFPPVILERDRLEHLGVKDDVVRLVVDLDDRRAVFVIAAVLVVPLMTQCALRIAA